ncbi:hypothetical protein EMCRGX_G009238 [Ephydatia muelleri]
MKALARSHVWWPDIDREIEGVTSRCKGCREVRQDPKLTPILPWDFLEGLWRRVHIDFAGPVEGKQLLIVVDAFSKWPEVAVMEDISTEKLLDELRAIFARWGIPSQDNGPQFTSQRFEQFIKANNCKYTRTSPYHPATNGLAERLLPSTLLERPTFHHGSLSGTAITNEEGSEECPTPDETRRTGQCVQEPVSASEITGSGSRKKLWGGGFSDGQGLPAEAPEVATSSRACQRRTKSYQVTLPGGGAPWRQHADQMVHVRKGVTLDVENPRGHPHASIRGHSTASSCCGVRAKNRTTVRKSAEHSHKTSASEPRHIPEPARDEPVNQGGGDESRITTRSHPIPSATPKTTHYGRVIRRPARFQDQES